MSQAAHQFSLYVSNFGHQPSPCRPSSGETFPRVGGDATGDSHMRWSLLAALSASPLVFSSLAAFAPAPSSDPVRISGPVTHENLPVSFIHGTSAPGNVQMIPEEALAK